MRMLFGFPIIGPENHGLCGCLSRTQFDLSTYPKFLGRQCVFGRIYLSNSGQWGPLGQPGSLGFHKGKKACQWLGMVQEVLLNPTIWLAEQVSKA